MLRSLPLSSSALRASFQLSRRAYHPARPNRSLAPILKQPWNSHEHSKGLGSSPLACYFSSEQFSKKDSEDEDEKDDDFDDEHKQEPKKKRPNWGEIERLTFLEATRGMTPSNFSAKLVAQQRKDPITWSDQGLARHYGLSVPKVRGIIRLQEHVERWEKNTPNYKPLQEINESIRNLYGTFTESAIKEQNDSLQRFKSIVDTRGHKYQLSQEFQKELKSSQGKEESSDSTAQSPQPGTIASVQTKSPDKNVAEESVAGREVAFKEIFRTGKVPDSKDTVTIGLEERNKAYIKKRLAEKGEFNFIFR